MKTIIKLLCTWLLIFICGSCMFVTTKEHISIRKSPMDEDVLSFKTKVKAHYDSLSKLQKFGNSAFEDAFLEKNIEIVYDTIKITNEQFVEIGDVTGKAKLSDNDWLFYKMKKKALMEGANRIVFFKSSQFDNRGSLWRILTGKNNDPSTPPTTYVYCTGKAVFLKK